MGIFSATADTGRPWTSASTVASDWTLQQLAPYIGRMKTAMARFLVEEYSRPNDIVADPFCGSGIVPFEAAAMRRRVLAGDINPYGLTLTRAKLFAPTDLQSALDNFERTWARSHLLLTDSFKLAQTAPDWVKKFFHPETLVEAIAVREACLHEEDTFSLACLLGILHHQRPGFLSFPSSHLVPYLRDKKFPRDQFKELYEYRDVYSRMVKKIKRTYRRTPPLYPSTLGVYDVDACEFPCEHKVDAVITSPPYMNLLDYGRDNRLRLWFLRGDQPIPDFPRGQREAAFRTLMERFLCHWVSRVRTNGHIILVLGDVARGGKSTHPASVVKDMVANDPRLQSLQVIGEERDAIPDIRRSRREVRGGKEEIILAIRRGA